MEIFIKIRSVGTDLSHADGRRDGQTHKLTRRNW